MGGIGVSRYPPHYFKVVGGCGRDDALFLWLNNKSLTKGARAVSANIVSVDEDSLCKDIENLVRKTVEETLGAMLDWEMPGLVGSERYQIHSS